VGVAEGQGAQGKVLGTLGPTEEMGFCWLCGCTAQGHHVTSAWLLAAFLGASGRGRTEVVAGGECLHRPSSHSGATESSLRWFLRIALGRVRPVVFLLSGEKSASSIFHLNITRFSLY